MNESESRDPREWMRSVVYRHEGQLTRYAAHLLGNIDAARDVVQETFLRFCNNGAPRDDASIAPWLFAVCRNLAFDQRRRRKPMISLESDDAKAQVDDGPTPTALSERDDMAGRAMAALAELPERQREAVQLRLQNDLSYREISEIMNTSIGNVGYLLHHAITAIRNRIEPEPPATADARSLR